MSPFGGEDEHTFDSFDLCVKLYCSYANLNLFLVMKYSMVTKDKTGGVAADDVMKTISSDYETKILTNLKSEFSATLTKENSFVPNGNTVCLSELSNGNADYQPPQGDDHQSTEQPLPIYDAPDTEPGIDCHEPMHALYAKCQELFKRTRRVQLQQKHRNLTKQMKVFVSQQQKFSTVTCLRYNDRCSVSQNELGQDNKDKIIATIDTLRYNLRHLETKYDSDATDSSSGDDSCDELEESDYRNFATYSVPEAHTASVSSSLPSTSTSSSNLNRHVPIRNRSSWKWCTERSAIASRWSWLQAQVTDLETKLRQQNDIFRHLRATKGSIVFGDDENTRRHFPSSSSINANHASLNNNNFNHQSSKSPSSSLLSHPQPAAAVSAPAPLEPLSQPPLLPQGNNNADEASSLLPLPSEMPATPDVSVSQVEPSIQPQPQPQLKPQPENVEQPQPQQQLQPEVASLQLAGTEAEEVKEMEVEVKVEEEEEQEEPMEESSCMRTIPFVSMKRRKLVRSESTLAVAVKKAVKYSSIQCSCNLYPPYVPPCVICTGRYSYMHSIDPEFMPYYERVSLLDSACHPVLCLPNDVPLGVHFTQLLKRENIHSKPVLLRNNKKRKINNILGPLLTGPSADGSLKTKKLTLANSISKPKKKIDKNKKRRLSTDSLKRANRERVSSGCSSRAESPIPSPCPSETSSNGGGSSLTPLQTPTTPSAHLQRRRRSEQHAFDINNIVIPYSIAAANRIEKLQYKEIITPKWRVNEEFAIPPPLDSSNTKLTQINGKEEESVGSSNSSNSNNIADSNSLEEDISQSAFEARHSKCEESERQRILSYYVGLTKNQNRKGTGRVRFESKSDSVDGFIQQQDASTPNTPATSKGKSKANHNDGYGFERKRHSSFSSKFSFSTREDSIDEEFRPFVPPFELRQFPLPDATYDLMLQESSFLEEDAEEETMYRSRRDSAKNSDEHFDSADDGTHASNSIGSSSPANMVDEEAAAVARSELFHEGDHGMLLAEKDDPEWKPSKM